MLFLGVPYMVYPHSNIIIEYKGLFFPYPINDSLSLLGLTFLYGRGKNAALRHRWDKSLGEIKVASSADPCCQEQLPGSPQWSPEIQMFNPPTPEI